MLVFFQFVFVFLDAVFVFDVPIVRKRALSRLVIGEERIPPA